MKDGDVVLLENTRYRAEETKNVDTFSEELASLADIFVNDAFGTAHRAHCSNVGVTKYIKTAVSGYLIDKEIKFLGNAVNNPVRPLVAVLGGSKVSSKISVINNLLEKVDTLIIGGGMAYTFMKAKGLGVGESLLEEEYIDYAKEMRDFVAKGGKWIYSDMFELYLDYPHSMIPLKKVYEFEPHLYKYAIPKCKNDTPEEQDIPSGLLGFEACTWTEHIDNEKDLCEHIVPRVYALAERANGELHTDYENFKKRVREKTRLLDRAGIPYTKEEWWDPKGFVRLKDAVSFYLNMGKDVDEEEAKKQAASAAPKLPFVLHFIKEFYLKEK